MTLGFSTTWPAKMGELAGQPTYFVDRVWLGIQDCNIASGKDITDYYCDHIQRFKTGWDRCRYAHRNHHKIHTLREDRANIWREGMDIHMVINSRRKDRFQFAPVVKCTAVQYVLIEYIYDGSPVVLLGNSPDRLTEIFGFNHDYMAWYGEDQMIELAQNDGFDSIDDFFRYFNESCQLKLIHWTDKRY